MIKLLSWTPTIGTINQLTKPIATMIKNSRRKVPDALGIFFLSSHVTGAFRIIAKTIASRNRSNTVITVRAKRNKIPIPIANANALIRADVRFMLLILFITSFFLFGLLVAGYWLLVTGYWLLYSRSIFLFKFSNQE